MERNDFWTTVVAAVLVFVAASPSLLPPGGGQTDNYGPMRWLLLAGPLAMVVLAVLGRRLSAAPGHTGELDEHDQ
jgi:hypothetical protein